MKVLNRNQYFPMDFPMRGVRAVILCLLAAHALSGCMRTTAPVAAAQPQSDLDSMVYGQSNTMVPTPMAYAGERWS
jgi:polysaccharide export outer membrane protein